MIAISTAESNSVHTRASLVHRLSRNQDNQSWEEFYRIYGKLVRDFSLKAGLTRTEADEVVQETAIGMARHLPEYRYDPKVCRFKTWVLNLASWRVKDQLKKRKKDPAWAGTLPSCMPVASTEETDRTATIHRVPDRTGIDLDGLFEKEWRNNLFALALERVRDKFTLKQFQVFDLVILKEWPAADVAKSLGITLANVYVTRHRISAAIKKAAHRIEQEFEAAARKRMTSAPCRELSKQSATDGFTLVELLVVIAVIGILAGLLLPALARAKERAKLIYCVSNQRQLGVAFQLYRNDYQTKFPALGPLDASWRSFQYGGLDPLLTSNSFKPIMATNRPLYDYVKKSEVFQCPSDRGVQTGKVSWESWFKALGTSYKYNESPWVNTRFNLADPVMGLATKTESWVPAPSLHVLIHEPAALPGGDDPPDLFYSHFSAGQSTLVNFRGNLTQVRQHSVASVLFVDGHAVYRDFTRPILANTQFPAEPTPECVWYKPQ